MNTKILVVADSATMRQRIGFSLRQISNARVGEATEMIRSNPLNDTLPIMIVTAEGAAMDREKALAMGVVQKLSGEN